MMELLAAKFFPVAQSLPRFLLPLLLPRQLLPELQYLISMV